MLGCALTVWLSVHGQLAGAQLAGFVPEGSPLPAFELEKIGGGRVSSVNLSGKPALVIFLRPAQRHSLAALRELEDVKRRWNLTDCEWIGICSGEVTEEAVEGLIRASGFSGTLLLDPDRDAYARFGVVAVPSLAVANDDLAIVYSRPGWGKDAAARVAEHLLKALGKPAGGAVRPSPRTTPKIELARALIERGDLNRAENLLREALTAKPTLEGYVQLGEVLLRRGEADQALDLFREAKKRHRELSSLDLGTARALAALGRREEAVGLLREVVLHRPGWWRAHVQLGELHEQAGEKDLAIRHYRKALTILEKSLRSIRRTR